MDGFMMGVFSLFNMHSLHQADFFDELMEAARLLSVHRRSQEMVDMSRQEIDLQEINHQHCSLENIVEMTERLHKRFAKEKQK